MGRFEQSARAFIGLGLLVAACSGSSKTHPGSSSGGSGGTPTESICTAGGRRCDGLNVKVCSDDGSAETIEQTCLPTQTCSDGRCTDNACLPNTRSCKDGAIWKCDTTGSGSALTQKCAAGQFCRDDDGSASCSNQACTPGQAVCATDTATTCAMDGSGPQPGGTDCAATKQACYQGQCRDVACVGGMKVCQKDDVYLCEKNGTDVSLLADCQANQVCDADMGACRPKVCDVGKTGCNGTLAVKCNPFGSDWQAGGKDCAAGGSVCVSGECKKQTCAASAYFCQDGDVYKCDSVGVTSSLSQSCQPGYSHCQFYPGSNYAACAYNQCTANQLLCDGNVVRTCNADGSWPATGTDCGSGNYCDNGACKPMVCQPYATYCQDGDIWQCDYNGAPQQGSQQQCPAETACKLIGNFASCAPLPCGPGDATCIGNKGGICAADGQSLGSVTQDCGAAGNVCDVVGKCATTVSDTLGIAEDAETDYGGSVIGDVIDVTSARKVTELQMNLVLAAARELRWVIYEQVGTNFVARIDKVNSNQSGTGFFSSGAGGLTYTLKAGKRYLLAVAIAGGNSSISYFDSAPFSWNASFGNIVGRVNTTYSATFDGSYNTYPDAIYQMKVTTELP
jgi:hypothetical protein